MLILFTPMSLVYVRVIGAMLLFFFFFFFCFWLVSAAVGQMEKVEKKI